MTTVALVLSLSHSGSTLLDLILGGNSRCLGLGEVHNVLRMPPARLVEKFGDTCTCGRTTEACEFWGPFTDWLAENSELPSSKKFAALLQHVDEVFGGNRVVVDSSKKISVAETYRSLPDVELRVIHLLKDVRSYSVSQIEKADPGRRHPLRSVATFRAWHRKNRRIQKFVRANRIPHLQVGYEALCRRPDTAVRRICDFLGIEFEADMVALRSQNSHLITGNPLRHQPENRSRIKYDDRWLERKDWKLAALLCPRIMRYNARESNRSGAGEA
jgi:hypothetical protein